MILHHIQTSQDSALDTCLRYSQQSDGFLLSGNGVNHLLTRHYRMKLSPYSVYLLADDVIARGLQEQLADYPQISYQQFVELTLKYQKTITW